MTPVTVLVRAEAGGDGLEECLAGVEENLESCGEIYLAGSLSNGLTAIYERWRSRLPSLHLGHELPAPDSDLWILSPGVHAPAGTLRELTGVLRVSDRHAIAIPRSNRAGFWRMPLIGPAIPVDDAQRLWTGMYRRLRRFQVVPAADSFCMLAGRDMLRHFGMPLDGEGARAYSQKINRYGYSTVLCNWAFVRSPPGPEYDWGDYLDFDADPVDYFAALEIPHRPRLLYDLTHLAPHFYGTADFALNLLRGLRSLVEDVFDLYLDLTPTALDFFRPEVRGYRIYREEQAKPLLFDLAFKPTQINGWEELDRLNRLAPRVAYTIQDMIAVRCAYLSRPGKALLFRIAAELCDRVFAISQSVTEDFAALTGSARPLRAIRHGTNFGVSAGERFPGTYVLLMGNTYTHKGLREALLALEGTACPVVVFGVGMPAEGARPNVRYLESGGLSREGMRETLAGARVLVYPSHYEGFGLPVVDALALGKPVIALDNRTNREIAAAAGDPNLHLIPTLRALPEAIDCCPTGPGALPRRWSAAAEEYMAEFRDLLGRGPDDGLLRRRWDFLRGRRV